MTTSIALTIGGTNVAGKVKRIEVQDEVNGVGRFRIFLDNQGGTYNNVFEPHEFVDIDVAGAHILNGWVDGVHRSVDDDPDVLTQFIEVAGRSVARQLTDFQIDKYYLYQRAGNIIQDMVDQHSGHKTIVTSVSGQASLSGQLSFDAKMDYLLDAVKEVAGTKNHDFTVNFSGNLLVFSVGSQSTGVTLQATAAGGAGNNIISLEWDEEEGTDIKNYIIIRGKRVDDGWTEFNISGAVVKGWRQAASGAVSDETTIVNAGVASLKFVKGAATQSWLDLNFTNKTYGYTSLDWSGLASDTLSFAIYPTAVMKVYIRLEDTSGNRIWTMFTPRWGINTWHSYSVSIGKNTQIYDAVLTHDGDWEYYGADTTFTWIVDQVRIGLADDMWLEPGGADFYLDALKIPNSMIAVAQNSGSQSLYGVRQLIVDKQNIESQLELEAEANDILAKRKDSIQTVNIVAVGAEGISGSTNNWIPGYLVTVNVPDEGINNVTYRIISVRHIFDAERPRNGFDYTVELDLAPNTATLDMERWQALRSRAGIVKGLRGMLSVLQQQEEAGISRYPALPAPLI